MPDVLTFGEIMLRLTTPGYQRFSQNTQFDATFGGAEANVAVAIASLGGSAGYLTRLPQNELADRCLADLRSLCVDVSTVVRGGDRLGLYFLEQGISQRAGKVVYDRAHSAMATATRRDFDWRALFSSGVRWFHWSGITPALSPEAPGIIQDACAAARARGVTISFDLNFRAKLWTPQQAGEILTPLMQYVDLCVTSAEEARYVFGIDWPEDAIPNAAESEGGRPDRDECAAAKLVERFGFKTVALTKRSATAAETTEWSAMLHTAGQSVHSRRHQITIVDRLGAGDSFSGALIFALRRGDSKQAAIDFAIAASALKHTIQGDFNRVSLEEVEALAAGATGGRVRR
jgi:2-dehydro-3-deoxygluconokinase